MSSNYSFSIPGGLAVERMISVTGVCGTNPKSSGVFRLQCGPGENEDIVLSIGVRPSENAVVRNTFENGRWGVEERDGGFPFHPGKAFILTILTGPESYKISVDGEYFAGYKHRMPYQKVKTVAISQDVKIRSICYD